VRRIVLSVAFAVAALAISAGPVASPRPAGLIGIEIGLDELLDIADIDAPDLGTGLLIHIDWPAEAPFEIDGEELTSLTAAITPLGVVETRRAIRASDATGDNASKECSDDSYRKTGPEWPGSAFPIRWKFKKASVPSGLNNDTVVEQLRTAHGSWVRPFSSCSNRPDVDFAFKYGGKTTRVARYDGYNIMAFGSPGATALAVNYIWYKSGKILEADTVFNKHDYTWATNKKTDNKYQIINVAAHELGHQVGLEDLADPHGRLTMFGRTSKGDRNKVSLGRGDMKGLNALSP
jgi:hypothetical protein